MCIRDRDHGVDGNQGALMDRLTVLQKVQQEAYEAFTEARLTCDTLRHTIQERETQREQRNQSISSIIDRLTPLRNLLVSTTPVSYTHLDVYKRQA